MLHSRFPELGPLPIASVSPVPIISLVCMGRLLLLLLLLLTTGRSSSRLVVLCPVLYDTMFSSQISDGIVTVAWLGIIVSCSLSDVHYYAQERLIRWSCNHQPEKGSWGKSRLRDVIRIPFFFNSGFICW